jgi:hypothetical protein
VSAMAAEPEEVVLPYTPSHSGRRARVGYLGFDGVGFNDLWPLFGGLVLSIGLGLDYFVGDGGAGRGWAGRTVLAAAPAAARFLYLRLLVVGRPPHFKGDLWATALGLRLDFTDPPFPRLPLLPRVVAAPAASGPERAAAVVHPRRHP